MRERERESTSEQVYEREKGRERVREQAIENVGQREEESERKSSA